MLPHYIAPKATLRSASFWQLSSKNVLITTFAYYPKVIGWFLCSVCQFIVACQLCWDQVTWIKISMCYLRYALVGLVLEQQIPSAQISYSVSVLPMAYPVWFHPIWNWCACVCWVTSWDVQNQNSRGEEGQVLNFVWYRSRTNLRPRSGDYCFHPPDN